ncbi:unnamed protein product [Phaeothamnion confervicola]
MGRRRRAATPSLCSLCTAAAAAAALLSNAGTALGFARFPAFAGRSRTASPAPTGLHRVAGAESSASSAAFGMAEAACSSRRLSVSHPRRRPGAPLTVSSSALEDAAAVKGKVLKLGVLLLNLGGPERGEDVEPFLYNLFRDPDIIRLPGPLRFLQQPIASFISKRRAPKSRSAYESIGGGSPIARWTNAQAAALEATLDEKGLVGARAYVAMRYWHPFTSEALAEMQRDGITAAVIIPLYPHFSISTSGSSLRVLQEAFASQPSLWGPSAVAHTVVPSWHNRPGYVGALSRLVAKEVAALTPAQHTEGVHVLFSAHGVPKSYIEVGDPYQRQIEECTMLVSRRTRELLAMPPSSGGFAVPFDAAAKSAAAARNHDADAADGAASGGGNSAENIHFHLSYQSRVGPVEWLQPYTESKIEQLAASGCKNLVVVPVSFVSEHIETLEEIDMEYREVAEAAGIETWRRVPALGTDTAFIDDMAEMVVEALAAPALTVAEAVLEHNCDRSGASGDAGPFDRLLEPFGPAATRRRVGTNGGSGGGGAIAAGAQVAGGGVLAGLAGVGSSGSRLATLGTVMFLADGVGREILTNPAVAHLPLHCG